MDKKVKSKSSKQHIRIGLICLVLFLVLLFRQIFFIQSFQMSPQSYFEYFLDYRIPDFITQLVLIILSLRFFIKYLNSTERTKINIFASVWCFAGALLSLAWSFGPYFQQPIQELIYIDDSYFFYIYKPDFYGRCILPGLLSSLVLFGTSIFFFITRNYTEEKILRTRFVKKTLLVDPKIDSDTRKNIMEKVSISNLKNLISSLTCVKCGSTAKLSFYPVRPKSSSRNAERDPNYTYSIFDAPVCDSCRRLYDNWYSIHRKTKRHVPRTIGYITFLLLFLPGIFFLIVFVFVYITLLIYPLVAIIILIISIIRRKLAFSDQNSPYRNIKIDWGNKMSVKPDNFKKWTPLQDWVLYSLNLRESGKLQLTEIETILLNYLNEYKGSAFSPHALVKRAIGENFTEEYVEVINKLLKKMTQKGIINSNYHDGEPHYFSS